MIQLSNSLACAKWCFAFRILMIFKFSIIVAK